ncbi:MAG: hypothetical protein HYU98_07420 [Deltaproteobacteria bacterium]|nr:hypothetical protein [Deltaproteobacteria bacterium]
MSLPSVKLQQVVINFGGTDKVKDVEYLPNANDTGKCRIGTKISDTNGDGVADKLFICDKETPITEEYKTSFKHMSEVVEDKFGSFFTTSSGAKCYKEKEISSSAHNKLWSPTVLCTTTDTFIPVWVRLPDSNGDQKPDSVESFTYQLIRSDGFITSYTITQHAITDKIRAAADQMFKSGLAVGTGSEGVHE